MDPNLNHDGNPVLPTLPSDDTRLPESVAEAQKILNSIRLDRGFLSSEYEEELLQTSVECQEAVRRLAETARRKTVKYTNSIAGELYSSKERFIYELLQNADDSRYPEGEDVPCVTISLYPNKLLFETNELGFTIANVKAVCDTGESSKKLSITDRSIGEKGYGFKSVFAIANRAWIQSGHWSFFFEHREGDDGLGMITPKDIPPNALPAGVMTRIELRLRHDPKDLFARLSRALADLHATTIFFLQRIAKLVIKVFQSDGSSSYYQIAKQSIRLPSILPGEFVSLLKTTCPRYPVDPMNIQSKLYSVVKRKISGMPADERRPQQSDSEVQLAFPIDPATLEPFPDDYGECVFAYLPLYRKLSLLFLIQGDFITLNSREDIQDCAWNDRLFDGVVETFCGAVQLFCSEGFLRYQWPKYLPANVTFGVERTLISSIKTRLRDLPVFESWHTRSMLAMSQVRIVPKLYTHENNPLVPDLDSEIYLAPEYASESYELLKLIGMQTMKQYDFLERLSHDLKGASPALYRIPSTDLWHASLSSALIEIMNQPEDEFVSPYLESLKLIKLRAKSEDSETAESLGTWVSGTEVGLRSVYFPECRIDRTYGGAPEFDCQSALIPYHLPFRVVDPHILVHPEWRTLLTKLSVRHCSSSTVHRAIDRQHSSVLEGKKHLSTDTLITHIQFLHLSWYYLEPLSISVALPLEGGTRANIGKVPDDYNYFQSDGPYDTWTLLKDMPLAQRRLRAKFVDNRLVEAEPKVAHRYYRDWIDWLAGLLLIRKVPPLVGKASSDVATLSLPLQRVLYDQPGKFVPALQSQWSAGYSGSVKYYPSILPVLHVAEVPCINGTKTALAKTYLETAAMKSAAERFDLRSFVPFIHVSDPTDIEKWSFLGDLGVRREVDLDFLLELLAIARRVDSLGTISTTDVTKKLYSDIGQRCNKILKSHVAENLAGIYIPGSMSWKQPNECLWTAPACISVKSPLAHYYDVDDDIKTLFCDHLGISDVHISDFLNQLRYSKKYGLDGYGNPISHSSCREIYSELQKHNGSSALLNHMRETIKSEKLIYANGSWWSPVQCLWSTEVNISDRVSIATMYFGLKGLFVNRLHVKTLTSAMLISELSIKSQARSPLAVAEAKELIFKINQLILTEGPNDGHGQSFETLQGCLCYPVRQPDGTVVLKGSNEDFALDDHERFSRSLGAKIHMLDFDHDEIQNLGPFLTAASLTGRYLSRVVKESSEIRGMTAQNEQLTTRLQNLAYPLYCWAVRFKSKKVIGQDPTVYLQLSKIQIWEAAEMGTSIGLIQNKTPISEMTARAQIKIDLESDPWRVYVPNVETERKRCYMSQFPTNIAELLGVSDVTATSALCQILISDTHGGNMQDEILELFDIQRVAWVTRPPSTLPPRPSTPKSSTIPRPTGLENLTTTNALSPPITPFVNTANQAFSGFSRTPVHTPLSRIPFASATPSSNSAQNLSGSNSRLEAPVTEFSFGSPGRTQPRQNAPFVFGGPIASPRIGITAPDMHNEAADSTPSLSIRSGATGSTLFGSSQPFGFASRSPSLHPAAEPSHRRAVSMSPSPASNLDNSRVARNESLNVPGSSTRRSVSVSSSPRHSFQFSLPPRSSSPEKPQLTMQQEKYRVLLDRIIRRVSGDSQIWNFNALISTLPATEALPFRVEKDEIFGVRSDGEIAHDKKIGAAGELFVVEKLIAASLPGFNRDHWISTIRHQVKIHEKYAEMPDKSPKMPPGLTAEPSDILYADPSGKFVEYLKTQDCVGLEDWLLTSTEPQRRFFIEVKATTKDRDEVFHMSKPQYTRMLKMRKQKNIQPKDVYIICRVYNLLSNDINMRFYVSPGRNEEARNSTAPAAPQTASANPFAFLSRPPADVESQPILNFTSKGFTVEPVKKTTTTAA